GRHIEPYLFVVLEGGRLHAGGLRVALGGLDSLRVGRGEARALVTTDDAGPVLTVPDARMSGSHARIVRTDGQYLVTDCGSTNGTLVDGAPVATHALRDGDLVELGQTLALYREIEHAGPATSFDSNALVDGGEPGFATLEPGLAQSFEQL